MNFAPCIAVYKVGLAFAAIAAVGALVSCGQSPKVALEERVSDALEGMSTPAKPEFPSMNAEMLRALSADVPALAPRLAELERAEKANLARAATMMREWAKEREKAGQKAGESGKDAASPRPQAALSPAMPFGRSAKLDPLAWLVPRAYAQGGDVIVATVSGYTSGMLMSDNIGRGSGGKTGSESRTIDGPDGGKLTATLAGEADGTMSFSMESTVDIAPLGVVAGAKTTLSSKSMCPDVNGRVEFTIKTNQKAAATSGLGALAQQTGTLEAIVEVTTNESGEIASTVIKTKYDRKSSGKAGASSASGSADWKTFGDDLELTGQTKGSVTGKTGESHESTAAAAAALLGRAAATGASKYWQNGNCIKIEAKAPYRPKPGATTDVPVAVIHKTDGSAVAARVDAKLAGGQSLTPVVIRRTPGSLTHVAPDKKGVQMSIELQARSRRGSAFERYFFETVDLCYDIDGGGGEFRGTGSTCDLTQSFTVEGNAGIVVDFTPTSKDGGTYSYTGNAGGAKLSGKGTYQVQYNGETPVGITGSGPGTACSPMGCFSAPGTEKYTLSPQ